MQKCKNCGKNIMGTDKFCPYCGSSNDGLRKEGSMPKTIIELKDLAYEREWPLSRMNFYLGYNVDEPNATGIYEDQNGEFIVYKNKPNGKRVVVYRGNDEAAAVSHIFKLIRQNISNADKPTSSNGGYYRSGTSTGANGNKKASNILFIIVFVFIMLIMISIMFGIASTAFRIKNFNDEIRYQEEFYIDIPDGWDEDEFIDENDNVDWDKVQDMFE